MLSNISEELDFTFPIPERESHLPYLFYALCDVSYVFWSEILGLVRELLGPNWSDVRFLSKFSTFSAFDFVELGDLAKEGFENNTPSGFKIFNNRNHFETPVRRWKAIFVNFVDSYTLTLVPPIDDFLRLLTFTSAVILHDAVYQFLRIFYYSRFKPPSLRKDLK